MAMMFLWKIRIYQKRLLGPFGWIPSPLNLKYVEDLSVCLLKISLGLLRAYVKSVNNVGRRFLAKKEVHTFVKILLAWICWTIVDLRLNLKTMYCFFFLIVEELSFLPVQKITTGRMSTTTSSPSQSLPEFKCPTLHTYACMYVRRSISSGTSFSGRRKRRQQTCVCALSMIQRQSQFSLEQNNKPIMAGNDASFLLFQWQSIIIQFYRSGQSANQIGKILEPS